MRAAIDLATQSPNEPRCVLLRHAERPPLQPGEPGTELELTENGKKAAVAYGQTLKDLVSIRTSPLARCRQTAECIRNGAQANTPIVEDTMLGDPGAYIADPEQAWQNWLQYGQEGVLRHLAQGRTLPGFHDLQAATDRLISHLLDGARGPGTHLAVTHDSVMIALLAVAHGKSLEVADYPGYLESVLLARVGGKVWVGGALLLCTSLLPG